MMGKGGESRKKIIDKSRNEVKKHAITVRSKSVN